MRRRDVEERRSRGRRRGIRGAWCGTSWDKVRRRDWDGRPRSEIGSGNAKADEERGMIVFSKPYRLLVLQVMLSFEPLGLESAKHGSLACYR